MSTQMRRIFDESMDKVWKKDETIEFYQSECKALSFGTMIQNRQSKNNRFIKKNMNNFVHEYNYDPYKCVTYQRFKEASPIASFLFVNHPSLTVLVSGFRVYLLTFQEFLNNAIAFVIHIVLQLCIDPK